jgi:hypothetical protein
VTYKQYWEGYVGRRCNIDFIDGAAMVSFGKDSSSHFGVTAVYDDFVVFHETIGEVKGKKRAVPLLSLIILE